MRMLAIVLTTMFAALAAAPGVLAQASTPSLAFSPASSTAAPGNAVNVDVTIANVAANPGLGGYDIVLTYTASVVRLDSLTDAGLLTQNIVICTPAQIDNSAGKATINCTPVPLFNGPGFSTTSPVAMLHASFTALAAGASPLSLTGSTIQDPSSNNLGVTLGTGSITVRAASSSSPTPVAATPAAKTTATATPAATASAAPPTPTATSAGAASPAPQPSATQAAAVRAPATGTGGGGSTFGGWRLAAVVAVALLAISGGGFALRGWRHRSR